MQTYAIHPTLTPPTPTHQQRGAGQGGGGDNNFTAYKSQKLTNDNSFALWLQEISIVLFHMAWK